MLEDLDEQKELIVRAGTYFVCDATTMLERSSDRSQKQDGKGRIDEERENREC
ncbi:conserved hypothetical protein [Ricinus communis]|uniref:Uncharacterized protein n=1 Tax=Ricinus communis TaxID=3988 RepID=B9T952_RICCO|nr:conserved hypothetical protein [Ricinus communis]